MLIGMSSHFVSLPSILALTPRVRHYLSSGRSNTLTPQQHSLLSSPFCYLSLATDTNLPLDSHSASVKSERNNSCDKSPCPSLYLPRACWRLSSLISHQSRVNGIGRGPAGTHRESPEETGISGVRYTKSKICIWNQFTNHKWNNNPNKELWLKGALH